MIDNRITIFDWDNRLSTDGVTNVGYDDDLRLMNKMFAMIKINWWWNFPTKMGQYNLLMVWGDKLYARLCWCSGITTYNEINLFEYNNRLGDEFRLWWWRKINEYTVCSDDNLLIMKIPNKKGTIESTDGVVG